MKPGDDEAKEKMIKYSILSGIGILSLLTMGVLGVLESRKNDDRVLYGSYSV